MTRNSSAGLTVYLASPNTQQQAEHASGMPVLLSYAIYAPWLCKGLPAILRTHPDRFWCLLGTLQWRQDEGGPRRVCRVMP